MSFDGFGGDGFGGDGFEEDVLVAPRVNPLDFLLDGRRINVIVEVEFQPKLRGQTLPPFDPGGDGFFGDGFSGGTILDNAQTAPRRERFSLLPTNYKANDPVLPNTTSRAILRKDIRIKQSFDVSLSGTSAQFSRGAIELEDADYLISRLAAENNVDGRTVNIYLNYEGGTGADEVLIASAAADVIQTDQRVGRIKTATIRLSDLTTELGAQVQRQTFSGTGGLQGDPGLEGQRKPFLIGRRPHIPGVLYDSANLLYMDHTGPTIYLGGFFGGEPAPFYADVDSEAELIAIRDEMPEGSWATCSALGIRTIRPVGDYNPQAPQTPFGVDAIGQGGAAEIGDACVQLLLASTDLGLNRIDQQAFSSLNVGQGGIWLSGAQDRTVQSVLEEMTSAVFGRLTVGQVIGAVLLRDPQGAADFDVTETAIGATLRRKDKNQAFKAFTVTYAPKDLVLSADQVVLPDVNPDVKESYQRAFETLDTVQGELTDFEHPTAGELFTLNSVLIDQVAAATVQQRLKDYGQYESFIWEVELQAGRQNVFLGSVITMTIDEHPEWSGGKQALVVGLEPAVTKGRFLAELLAIDLTVAN